MCQRLQWWVTQPLGKWICLKIMVSRFILSFKFVSQKGAGNTKGSQELCIFHVCFKSCRKLDTINLNCLQYFRTKCPANGAAKGS